MYGYTSLFSASFSMKDNFYESLFVFSGPSCSNLTTSLVTEMFREADYKHRASDGNSKFCILLKISRLKGLDERDW